MKLFKNNVISLPYLMLMIAPLFSAYRGPVVKENEKNAAPGFVKYTIDTIESVVTWKCSMSVGTGEHSGYVDISKGELMIGKGRLVGGTVEINMNSIANEFHRTNNKLVNHLKSSDFFDVDKFPRSTFAVTQVAPAKGENISVTGDLTIKGITHPVTFPATLEVKDGMVNAKGKVIIDRTQWDVRYRSGKFFDNLADGAISDDIEFDVKIVAKK
jgi:polyisoprenoid-binding protein YceI